MQDDVKKTIAYAEATGRTAAQEILKSIFPSIYFENQDTTAHTDFDMTAFTQNGNRTYKVEHKSRDYRHNDFSEWFIKVVKANNLMKEAKELGKKPIYTNLFTDGYLTVWDFSQLDLSKMKTTKVYEKICESDPHSKKAWFNMYLLPSNKAIKTVYDQRYDFR